MNIINFFLTLSGVGIGNLYFSLPDFGLPYIEMEFSNRFPFSEMGLSTLIPHYFRALSAYFHERGLGFSALLVEYIFRLILGVF